jgi:hypothetical protein
LLAGLTGAALGIAVPLLVYSVLALFGTISGADLSGLRSGGGEWAAAWAHFRLSLLAAFQMAMWALNLRGFAAFRINHVLIFDAWAGSALRADKLGFATAAYLLVVVFCLGAFVRRQLADPAHSAGDVSEGIRAFGALRAVDQSDPRMWCVAALNAPRLSLIMRV